MLHTDSLIAELIKVGFCRFPSNRKPAFLQKNLDFSPVMDYENTVQDKGVLLSYLQRGVKTLADAGKFPNGWEFRPTQAEAVAAYNSYLHDESRNIDERLTGFFEIPTGVGKTAVFVAIIDAAMKEAEEEGKELKTMIVVPTINLMKQTRDAFAEVIPDIKKGRKIGLYGGAHRKLGNPITIISYDSWVNLIESGKLGADNVDILISDEAHRGISDKRIKLLEIFNGVACIGFTATAAFDQERTIEKTHKKEIFRGKIKIMESVKRGELSRYINTQIHVIRIEPPDLADEFDDVADEQYLGELKGKMKREAWNRFAIALLRDGRDEITGEPLSDNISGFFAYGTKHADQLAEMLNADEELQKKAKDKGCKGVAIAIHTSNMSGKEQERRLAAVKRGEYLAIIGDKKFKEGFDYGPLKNIFDYPRGSLVDKSQIIGRALRRWHNRIKATGGKAPP